MDQISTIPPRPQSVGPSDKSLLESSLARDGDSSVLGQSFLRIARVGL